MHTYTVYNNSVHICAVYAIISIHHLGPMHTSYAQKKSISITLDLEVYDDFNINSIDFHSLLEIEGDEKLEVSVTGSHSEVY